MRTWKYAEEQINFVRENAEGKYNDELAKLYNEYFGTTGMTVSKMKSLKANHKIRSNVDRSRPRPEARLLNKEQHEFLVGNLKGTGNQELADLINSEFGLSLTAGQIISYKASRNLSSGLTGWFNKGQKAWNKGKKQEDYMTEEQIEKTKGTRFKPGQVPTNYRPIGSERIDLKDGYIVIKVQDERTWPERWRHKHVVVWEEANGKVPENHVIVFLDSNKENIALDNLTLISRPEHIRMNQLDLYSSDPELTKAGLNIVRLNNRIIDFEIYGGDREEFQKYTKIAERKGLTESTFIARLKRGWSLEDALNRPLNYKLHRKERRR